MIKMISIVSSSQELILLWSLSTASSEYPPTAHKLYAVVESRPVGSRGSLDPNQGVAQWSSLPLPQRVAFHVSSAVKAEQFLTPDFRQLLVGAVLIRDPLVK